MMTCASCISSRSPFLSAAKPCNCILSTHTQIPALSFMSISNKLCTWRHNMPPPLSSAAAEQTQRSSSFTRPNILMVTAAPASCVKDHRQRIPRFVIRRYLEKSIQKKLFGHLQSLQIKTIIQEKTIINSISNNLLSRFIYGRDVIGANCVEQRRPENGKK